MKRIRAILFDWDGTLLDSYFAGFRASMAVFERFGIAADNERFLTSYSPNWYSTYRTLGIPEKEWGTADSVWLETYHRHPAEPFAFTRPTLASLHQDGYILGLVTSGNRDRVAGEIDRLTLKAFFSTFVFFEDTREKKPHPEPLLTALDRLRLGAEEAVYVGDRPEDIAMGRTAGAFTVGVSSAYGTRELLEAALPDLLLPDVSHLPPRLLRGSP